MCQFSPSSSPPTAALTRHDLACSSCFEAYRLTGNIFRVIENDSFGENPFIYIKLYPDVIVIVDTGCNSPREAGPQQVTSLRQFLETTAVPENGGQPLNPSGQLPYLILLTHCHYDHIGGLVNFGDAATAVTAVGDALQSEIISQGHLHKYSLREELKLTHFTYPTPLRLLSDSESIHWVSPTNGSVVDLRLQVVTTPGHSLDSIVILDHSEHVAFLGDSAYESGWLFYAHGSDLFQHCDTLGKVERLLVDHTNAGEKPWIAASGHITAGIDAIPLLQRIQNFILNVLRGVLTPTEIGNDHIRPRGIALFKADGLSMAVPEEQLVSSIEKYKCM